SGQSSSSGPVTSSGSASSSASATSSSATGGMICPGFGDMCSNCLSMGCPATYCNCYNDPQCLAIFTCQAMCGGNANCKQGCLSSHPSGISEAYLLSDCAGAICAAQCPGNKPVDPCTKCVLTNCPAAMNACLAEPECLALYNCLEACGN